jgi:very-short-patch-repair endonuclease
VEKMRQKLIGREFLHRGGNGKTTKPQEILYNLLGDGWIMEFAINTKDVREKFNKIPNSYKTDIAHPDLKISIEIDGMGHKLKKKMELDLKKTQVLNSLGWKVLRFWNKEVMTNQQMCLQKIQECMI